MKAILEFDLDDCEDRLNHKKCIEANNAFNTISEILHILRQYDKYENYINEETTEAIGKLRDEIVDVVNMKITNFNDLES